MMMSWVYTFVLDGREGTGMELTLHPTMAGGSNWNSYDKFQYLS